MKSLFVQKEKSLQGIGYHVRPSKNGAYRVRILLPESVVYQSKILNHADVMTDGKKMRIQKTDTGFFVAHVTENLFQIEFGVPKSRAGMISVHSVNIAEYRHGDGWIEFDYANPAEITIIAPEPPKNNPGVDAFLAHQQKPSVDDGDNDDPEEVEELPRKKRGRPARAAVLLDGEAE